MMFFAADLPSTLHQLIDIAERHPRRAVEQARRRVASLPDGDTLARGWALFALAWVTIRWERVAEALLLLDEAERLFVDHDRSIARLHCRYARLTGAMAQGQAANVQDEWRRLADAYRDSGREEAATYVEIDYIHCLNNRGLTRESPALLDRFQAAFNALPDTMQARRWRVSAVAHGLRGDIVTALADINRSIEYARHSGMTVALAQSRLERGWLWFRGEQYAAAERELRVTRAQCERLNLPLQVAFTERTLGFVVNRLGRYNEALAYALSARNAFARLGRFGGVADCEMEIGNVAFYSGLHDIAMMAYRSAEQGYARLESPRLLLISRRNQALVLRGQGHAQQALALLYELEPLVAELGDKFELGEIMQAQGQALSDLGRHTHALECLRRAEQHFVALDNLPAAAEAVLHQGWQLFYLGEYRDAEACFVRASDLLADRLVHRWLLEYGRAKVAQQTGDTATALRWYRRAGVAIARLRHSLASEHASSGIFQQAQRLYVDALRLAADAGHGEQVLTLAEQQRALALQHHINRATRTPHTTTTPSSSFQSGIAAEFPDLQPILTSLEARHALQTQVGGPARFDLQRLRRRLGEAYPAGWQVVCYVYSGEELLIVHLRHDRCDLTRVPLLDELKQHIQRATQGRYRRYEYTGANSQRRNAEAPWPTLTALGRMLLPDTVRSCLAPHTRLMIVADGDLHALPWGALRLGEQWLCECAIVQLAPSLVLWNLLHARVRQGSRDALLIGCSHFGERAPALPFVESELAMVAAAWPGVADILVDETATVAALHRLNSQGELARFALIHLASHALLRRRRMLHSTIALWDGDLILDEIWRLRLGAALVVLSACNAAGGDTLPGDELVGLSRAWLAAGAKTVIASLWEVPDGATQPLLARLYGELAAGCDPAEALTLAQRALLAHATPDHPLHNSPFVWAGFCASGAG